MTDPSGDIQRAVERAREHLCSPEVARATKQNAEAFAAAMERVQRQAAESGEEVCGFAETLKALAATAERTANGVERAAQTQERA